MYETNIMLKWWACIGTLTKIAERIHDDYEDRRIILKNKEGNLWSYISLESIRLDVLDDIESFKGTKGCWEEQISRNISDY